MTQISIENVLIQWLGKNTLSFQYRFEKDVFGLQERACKKTIEFHKDTLADYRITPHPEGLPDYLNLVFTNQKQIVLCHAGIAFSPVFQSTGFIQDAPRVICMADYYQLFSQLQFLIKEPSRQQETILLFQVLISILDGAKDIGLDVGMEEKELDLVLTQFEKNKS